MTSSIAKLIVAVAMMSVLSTACAKPQMRENIRERIAQRRAEKAAERHQSQDTGRRAPVSLPVGAQLQRDLAYGSDPAQRMDVYRPANAANAPVILLVHGGGWRRGDKASGNVINNKIGHWLPKGYVVVSVGYRMSQDTTPVEQADDVARALAYAQQHAAGWGADASRFVLIGHSAGAHLVALLSADPGIATGRGAKSWLGTVALDSAALNVEKIMEGRHLGLYDRVFGNDRGLWRASSPTLRLQHAPVPMLLVCSSQRGDSCAQAREFAAKATGLGGQVRVQPVDLSHGQINEQLGTPGSYTAAVDAFMHSLGLK